MTKPIAPPAPTNDSTLVGGHLTRREALAFRAAIRHAHFAAVRIRPADARYQGRHFAPEAGTR